MSSNPFDPVEHPILPGETIQRRYMKKYEAAVKDRTTPVDLSAAAELLQKTDRQQNEYGRRMLEEAREHLRNANNPELPIAVREQHFDIAGACLWEASHNFNVLPVDRWFGIWKEAGGL